MEKNEDRNTKIELKRMMTEINIKNKINLRWIKLK
jgi:hypothetical protein